MPLSVFQLFSPDEFANYIKRNSFTRKVTFLQNHHTWLPRYNHFKDNPPNHIAMLESMRRDHIHSRGWRDIGQNLTVFPDGKIALCRPLNDTPAGILGANTGGICIEHIGNFDSGEDQMIDSQKEAIIQVNAVLCDKFGLSPNPQHIVYHHWYNTKGKRFTDSEINSGFVLKNKLQKTCPGTAFFGGNTITAAQANFYPAINDALAKLKQKPVNLPSPSSKTVNADILNVRAGKGTQFGILRRLMKGTQVNIYEEAGGWSKVNSSAEEWVASQYLS